MTSAQGQMIALHNSAGEKIGRSHGAKRAEVIDQMGLVIVTVRRCGRRPIDFSIRREGRHCSLKTADALKEFRRQADLLAKNPAESPLTESYFLQDGGNGRK
jgi:hypothetical protein